ncbi:MAG: formylglycine-generating enzyme family protein [Gemmatimonadetes bacterium]|nr:formylglycine-generating enzyme family protein [Gemmatimonadota bacterium]
MITALLLSLSITLPSDTTVLVAGVETPFVRLEPGTFERENGPDEFQRVVLTEGFWLGKYEVTWEAWEAVMGNRDDQSQPSHPARQVSWIEVSEFLERASAGVEGWGFRLPTEAEWEYAARAGSPSDWTSGPDSLILLEYAWIRRNAEGAVQPVGGRRPNAWGLHDMHGNVWEWTADWMGPYPDQVSVTDPKGPTIGTERVRRGGSAVYGAAAARSSYRYQQPPNRGNGNLGFRIVATPTSEGAI